MKAITSLTVTMHRFERVALGDQDILERSAVEHERIAECLQRGDLDAAVAALKENWNSGTHRILEHLTDRPRAAGPW
ncbi:FCD domain-containing protein [Streptomyces atratus]|uniref:FCD domain-containing protein n=1 Tax=Streptomyces atratus TaxID=1893 RepID=UPI0033C9D077